MAPKPWASTPQFEYLNPKLEVYLQLQAVKKGTRSDKRLSNFFDEIFTEWFLNWPEVDFCIGEGTLPAEASGQSGVPFELTKEQEEILQTAIEDRRKMLKSWFRNTSKKATGLQGTRNTSILGSVFQATKKSRAHKPEEIYQSRFKIKIDELMKIETEKYLKQQMDGSENADQSLSSADGTQEQSGIDGSELDTDTQGGNEQGADTDKGERYNKRQMMGTSKTVDKGSKAFRSWQMSTRRRIVKESWENETEDTKRLIMDEVEAEKRAQAELVDDDKAGMERTPEQRQFVIGNLVNLLRSTCEEIERLSGWSTTAITGGPNPAFGGQITIQTVSFGQTTAGRSFLAAFPEHKQVLNESFIQWLKLVYPKETRRGLSTGSDSLATNLHAMGSDDDEEGDEPPTLLPNGTCPQSRSALSTPSTPSSPHFPDDDEPALENEATPRDITATNNDAVHDDQPEDQPTHFDPPEGSREAVTPISDSQIDPALLALDPGFIPSLANAQEVFATQEADMEYASPLPLANGWNDDTPQSPPTTAANLDQLEARPAIAFMFPPGLFAEPQTNTIQLPTGLGGASPVLDMETPTSSNTAPHTTLLTLALAPPQTLATITSQNADHLSGNTVDEPPSPPSTFPFTRPALRPAPEPKLPETDSSGLRQRGRGRGRGRGQSGRGRKRISNATPPSDCEDLIVDPDQIQPLPIAVRRHVRAINTAQSTTPTATATVTTVNPDGEYPLFTMAPTHTKRLRVPRKAFGGQVYETTARLDAAARDDEGPAIESTTSKRKKSTPGSVAPSKKRARKN